VVFENFPGLQLDKDTQFAVSVCIHFIPVSLASFFDFSPGLYGA
jgi:hypothetical protein